MDQQTSINVKDPFFWSGMALVAGATFPIAPWVSACWLLGLVLALAVWHRKRWAVLALVLAFALGAGRAAWVRERAARDYAAATLLLVGPTRCVGQAEVIGSPVVRGDAARVEVHFLSVECGDRLVPPFDAFLSGDLAELARGDEVDLAATLSPVYLFRNEGSSDGLAMLAKTGAVASGSAEFTRLRERGWGIGALIDRARTAVRKRISATYHPAAEALGRALVLGETDLAVEDDAAFRASGLSHLLAVSGTHIVIAVLGALALIRFLLLRLPGLAKRVDVGAWAALIGVPLTFAYADFAGGGGSAFRAAWMTGGVLLARSLGKKADTARVLGFALVGSWLVDPLTVLDVSFLLSMGATLGLVVLSPQLRRWLTRSTPKTLSEEDASPVSWRRKIWEKVALALGTTLGPTLACSPILAMLTPRLPLLGVLANAVAAPLGELVALPVCLGHAVLTSFASVGAIAGLERGAARLGSGALLGVLAVARSTEKTGMTIDVPYPTPWELGALASLATLLLLMPDRSRWGSQTRLRALLVAVGMVVLIGLELRARASGAPKGELRVTMLDVGQGDSLFVDLPDGRSMLVDGGGLVGSPIDTGPRVLVPFLRARRRSSIDVVVLSHPHPDHYSGLLTGLADVRVGELWETGEAELRHGPPVLVDFFRAIQERGTRIRHPDDLCGEHRFGEAKVTVLAPCPGPLEARGANDNSLILHLVLGERSALLVGDAEQVEEKELIEKHGAALRSDFLKVGHHGSRTSSSPAFLAEVRPSIAAISCGVRNRFGHPNPIALQALGGIDLRRTDRGGEWVWSTDGKAARIESPYAGDPLFRAWAR